jgi:hypothetical protein
MTSTSTQETQLHRRTLLAGAAGLGILGITGIELASAQPASAAGHDPQDGRAAIIPPDAANA